MPILPSLWVSTNKFFIAVLTKYLAEIVYRVVFNLLKRIVLGVVETLSIVEELKRL